MYALLVALLVQLTETAPACAAEVATLPLYLGMPWSCHPGEAKGTPASKPALQTALKPGELKDGAINGCSGHLMTVDDLPPLTTEEKAKIAATAMVALPRQAEPKAAQRPMLVCVR